MPYLGEVKKHKEIFGRRNTSIDRTKYVWAACEICGKERWVYLRKGFPISTKCKKCSDAINSQIGRSFIKPQLWEARSRKVGGYVFVRLKSTDFFHPMAGKDSYVREHRLVMARFLRRCLLAWEVIHHKNGIKDDNRIENLELLPSPSKHMGITSMQSYIKKLEARIVELEKRCELKEIS